MTRKQRKTYIEKDYIEEGIYINKNGGIILNKRYFKGMTNVAREFVKNNKDSIVCEPSGKYLDDLETERRAPVRMKLVK